jgi:DNA-binding LacI/PurR family transcriptional regulator
MATASSRPGLLYDMIVQDICRRIDSGQLAAGDRVQGIDELCRQYKVSPITAKRAVRELQDLGLIHSVRGKGSFVTSRARAAADEPAAIKRIALVISSSVAGSSSDFFAEVWQGVRQAADRAKLGFRVQVIPDGIDDRHMEVVYQPQEGEGLVFLAPTHARRIVSLVQERTTATIMIDFALPFTDCVLTDNLDGMRQVVDHLKALGHRRLYLGSGYPYGSNTTNENERAAAFAFLLADRGLEGEVGSLDPAHVVRMVRRRKGPTAVLFNRDDPALDAMEALRAAGLRVPQDVSVTGFDGWSARPDDTLTTLVVDRPGLGQVAVQRLRAQHQQHYQWFRVPGRLRIGQTTGPAPTR